MSNKRPIRDTGEWMHDHPRTSFLAATTIFGAACAATWVSATNYATDRAADTRAVAAATAASQRDHSAAIRYREAAEADTARAQKEGARGVKDLEKATSQWQHALDAESASRQAADNAASEQEAATAASNDIGDNRFATEVFATLTVVALAGAGNAALRRY